MPTKTFQQTNEISAVSFNLETKGYVTVSMKSYTQKIKANGASFPPLIQTR